ncbi:hypothetical protein E2C01_061848 [Portunus trituberculatus]|uniref:Uncharacterized protein n=1 Tax=Portunus trituberculatus TaxID=210409 RepID=A0A5B7HCZ9_PORTR|nr:hypothetical protein [Portunus trituberculatus]
MPLTVPLVGSPPRLRATTSSSSSSAQFLSTPDNSSFEVRQTVRYKRHELNPADMESGADGGGDGRRTKEKENTKS